MKKLIILALVLCAQSSIVAQPLVTSNTFGSMSARQLGPATSSGRITAIEALYLPAEQGRPMDKRLCIYVGTAAGGVWKSKDNGTTFERLFEKEEYQSVGAMALDPRHQDSVLWVGTGESNCRNSVSIGGGLYKTTDAGESWKRVGLEKVERITKIAVNPKNPDVVLVAGVGALWGDSPDRGLYRTTDGGKSFTKVLYVDEKTGCSDVAIDPENPNIVYATMWQFRRKAYTFSSGGPGSGFYKSTDGGATWTKLTKTMPDGDLGRCIVAISPSKPNVVYAMLESKESGLYRSVDRGETWEKRSNAVSVTARPFYFSCLYVDPFDENRVYRPSFQLGMSNDGGKTFNGFNYGGGAHPDHHALWIDPTNPQHLLLGTDGGVYRSVDRGQSWVQFRNLPLAQFYHISYDFEEPYNVFGGLQDNGSWLVPHRVPGGGIQNRNWEATGWGDGFTVIRDRKDPNIIYFESQGGNAVRRHIRTNESRSIKPYEEEGEKKLRFNWNTPITQSPTNNSVIYLGSNFLHRSTNHGDTWERISPDLTTNDSAKYNPENSGGVTADNTSAENHCTIYTIAESPLDQNIIWVGTDDGNIQVTLNGGKTWSNKAEFLPLSLPKGTWVSTVEPSRFDKMTCYASFENHTRGDMTPYIYKTTDGGTSWVRLMSDSLRGFAHVIREDAVNKNLLFAGTELGLFISIDGGKEWARFKGNIPCTPVRDIQVHPREHDLIVATHGLGVFILDDITPLRSLTPQAMQNDLTFLPARTSLIRNESGFQEFGGSDEFYAPSPNDNAQIVYYLKARHMIGDMKIEILNTKGDVITTLPAGKRKGINRIGWGMSMKPPKVAVSQNSGGGGFGPTVLAGEYVVKITKDDKTYTGKVVIDYDKRSIHTREARKANFDAMMRCYALIERTAYAVEQLTSVRDTLTARIPNIASPEIKAKTESLVTKFDSLHKTIVAKKSTLFADTEPQLREKLADIYGDIAGFAGMPSADQLRRVTNLEKKVTECEVQLRTWFAKELKELNDAMKKPGLGVVLPITKEEFDKTES
ncbi:MAG: glycosyl hydrolase [Candidatus Kapabacteria bacterium]|nr:glycosyl hydrolase [Candidatus Kapabacteria bacterium]